MKAIFDNATRTLDALILRTPRDRLEMLDGAISEGKATITPHHRYGCELEWHGISATGADTQVAITNWMAAVWRDLKGAA